MQADWIWGLFGGGLIGLGGAVYLLGNGRIMGASGIIGGLVDGSARSAWRERLAFLSGLVGFPALLWLATGRAATTHLTEKTWVIVAAGLCVGLGTRIANGCTSGHGVCGISRLSLRGFVATSIYIAAGVLTVLLARHGIGVI